MIHKYGKISVFLILLLLLGMNLIPLVQASTTQNNEPLAQSYSTGAILLDESEIPNDIPQDLSTPPPTWDWRNATINGVQGNWMTPVKNQGKCGSCWSFAAIAMIEAMLNINLNDPDFDLDLSEQQLVSCCGYPCNGCRGGSPLHAWQYLLENGGAILESTFPYEEVDSRGCKLKGDCDEDPVECDDKKDNWDDQQIPVDEYMNAISEPDIETIQSLIVDQGPVVAYILVYSDLTKYNGGIYEHTYGDLVGGHVVNLVGYNDEEEYWIAKNSWGTIWGEDGYLRIAYGECYIEQQISYADVDMETLNFPPTADCGGIYQGSKDESIDFSSDQCRDLENNIITYQWDFGDGTTSNQTNPTHTYTDKGMYKISLTVIDEQGKTDTDEGVVFVDLWETGTFWKYDIFFETDDRELYPPILLPGSGSITNLTLTVTEEDEQSYYLDFQADFEAKLAVNVDIQNFFLNLRAWSSFKRGEISGSFKLAKAGFGIESYRFHVTGFGQLLALPIIPLPIWLPLPIDVSIEQTYETPKTLMGTIIEDNEQWEVPPSSASMDLTIQLLLGLFSKTFHADDFTDDAFSYECNEQSMVDTTAGSYQSYHLCSLSTHRTIDLYYSPMVQNIVKFDGGGGNSEILYYTGELISTNADE